MSLIGQANTSGVASGTTALSKEFRWRHPYTPKILSLPEAASSDFKYGEVVILSSQKVTQAATAPSALSLSSDVADGTAILGFALADASGTTDTEIPVLVADDNLEVLLRYVGSNTVATDSQEQDLTIGGLYPIARYAGAAATDLQAVATAQQNSGNANDDGNKLLCVEKLASQPATAEYAWAWFKVRKQDTDGVVIRVY